MPHDRGREDQVYIRKFMASHMLTQEEEENLAQRWRLHRDEAAFHALITAYTRLVVGMASKLSVYGVPMSDLVQEGNIGLIIAAEKFDPKHFKVRFSAYAKWWIKASQQKYILQNWSIVRMGYTNNNKQLFFNLDRMRRELESLNTDHMPDEIRSELSKKMKIAVKDIEEVEKRLFGSDLSLNSHVTMSTGETEETLGDFIADESENQEDILSKVQYETMIRDALYSALQTLTKRERFVIYHAYIQEPPKNNVEISIIMGISRERVRQISKRALRKVHRYIATKESHLIKQMLS